MLRSVLIGGAVYLIIGLLMIGIILFSVIIGGAGTQLSGGFGEASGFLTFIMVFFEMAFLPIGWFVISPVISGGFTRQVRLGAVGAGLGFAVTSGVSGIISFLMITLQMGVDALMKGAQDWWAPWILLLILAGAWVVGILISAGIGALSGLIFKALLPPLRSGNSISNH